MPYRKKKKRPLRLMMTNLLSKCEESYFLKTLEGHIRVLEGGKISQGCPHPIQIFTIAVTRLGKWVSVQ